MITTIRSDSTHLDFMALVKLLDADLAVRDGADHAFYAQFNKIDMIRHVVVAYQDGHAVACGAIKAFDNSTAEVKRMYTLPAMRGQRIAALVLSALEDWAKELGYNRCILETGHKQPEALTLYRKCGYTVIPNYGQYEGISNSVCFAKVLIN
jgi:putative acetyltransferase